MGCSANIATDERIITKKNDNIYKAYKCIKDQNDEIKSHNILKKDQLYLIYTHSIQNFVNRIEELFNKGKSEIKKQLIDEDPAKYEFDKLEFIDEANCEIKDEFIIVDKKFLEIMEIELKDGGNDKSVIINIDKQNNISQIEFTNHKSHDFIALDNLNFCFAFNLNNTDSKVEKNNLNNNNKTKVEKNNLNNNNKTKVEKNNLYNNNKTKVEPNNLYNNKTKVEPNNLYNSDKIEFY